jgi:hypothetical protein
VKRQRRHQLQESAGHVCRRRNRFLIPTLSLRLKHHDVSPSPKTVGHPRKAVGFRIIGGFAFFSSSQISHKGELNLAASRGGFQWEPPTLDNLSGSSTWPRLRLGPLFWRNAIGTFFCAGGNRQSQAAKESGPRLQEPQAQHVNLV